MEITESFKKNSIKSICDKVKDKKIGEAIHKSVLDFVQQYIDDNNAHFLSEQIYEQKVEEILCNLDSKQNPILLEALKKGTIDPTRLAFLKPEELDPEKYESIIKRKEIEEMKKTNKKTTDAFKCSKCHERKCSVEQKQTRAGDEPVTTFVSCVECGHTWSFN
jgi:transcription elongation factor S-II